jgi:hypothetical protein
MTSFRQSKPIAQLRNCAAHHRAENRSGQATHAAQCPAPWANRGDLIDGLEDSEDYRGFEAAVIADYPARTAVERELALRLASLLWRMRRAISIETDLPRIQWEIVRELEPRLVIRLSNRRESPFRRRDPYFLSSSRSGRMSLRI